MPVAALRFLTTAEQEYLTVISNSAEIFFWIPP